MCFVSDRNKSIWNVVATVHPGISHYACIYHLWTNVLKRVHTNIKEVRKLFFSLAKAYTMEDFDNLMSHMKDINPRCHAYLMKANFSKWSRAHSTIKRTETLTSNIAELINNAILLGRRQPVVPMLEYIRKIIETWNEKNNKEGRDTTTTLTAKYNQMLLENEKLANQMTIRASTKYLQTITHNGRRYIVCLHTRKCSCRKFQYDEIPCAHAIAAIEYRNKFAEDYCSIYYSTKNFCDAYAIPIDPLS